MVSGFVGNYENNRKNIYHNELDMIVHYINAVAFTPTNVEKHFVSHALKIQGTPDAIGTIGQNTHVIIDWKRANQISETYKYQLAMYNLMYGESCVDVIDVGIVVRIYQLKRVAATTITQPLGNGRFRWSLEGSVWHIEEQRYKYLPQYYEFISHLREVYRELRGK